MKCGASARPYPLPLTAPVGPPNLPKTRNRAGDVGRVESALGRAGILGGRERRRPVFDTRLETGVRAFQGQKGLRVDGLLNPGGPTIRALGRALARPPLKGLSGAAVSANARLIRHLMTTTADGMVPGLMAGDFGLGEAGRAKTADFLSQLFGRDPARARSLRAKARGLMATDEKSLLDKLILQARLADEEPDEEDDPTPEDPGQDDPDDPEPEEPDEPDEPEKPEKPKPDCDDLIIEVSEARVALAKAIQLQSEIAIKIGNVNEDIFDLNDKIADLEFKLNAAATGSTISKIPFPGSKVVGGLSVVATIALRAQLFKARNEIKKKRATLESLKLELETARTETEALESELEEVKARLKKCQQGEGS